MTYPSTILSTRQITTIVVVIIIVKGYKQERATEFQGWKTVQIVSNIHFNPNPNSSTQKKQEDKKQTKKTAPGAYKGVLSLPETPPHWHPPSLASSCRYNRHHHLTQD
jgi:hypothetical protein